MRIAGIITSDVANGPGLRTSVFVSGCNIHCKGCHNEKLWDFDYGKVLDDDLMEEILESIEKKGISGLTILGGEPLDIRNVNQVTSLIIKFRERFGCDKTIWLYTGYDFGKFMKHHEPYTDREYNTIMNVDVVVDGPFIEELKDITLLYRGSSNQRIIDVQKTYDTDEIVLLDIDKYGIQ